MNHEPTQYPDGRTPYPDRGIPEYLHTTKVYNYPTTLTDAYGIPLGPPPPPLRKARDKWKVAGMVVAILLMLTGSTFLAYSYGVKSVHIPAPVNVAATATAAYQSGYNGGYTDGKATQSSQDTAAMQSTATASYTSGKNNELQSLYNFLYNGQTASGQPCEVANITDNQGNSDYRFIRLYRDGQGNIREECLVS